MPTYLIEREIPGASQLTDDEIRGITTKSNDVVAGLERPYTWHHSYVAGDKIYCVHEAESAEVILEHARRGGFPANLVAEVAARVRPHRPALAPGLTSPVHSARADRPRARDGEAPDRARERRRRNRRAGAPHRRRRGRQDPAGRGGARPAPAARRRDAGRVAVRPGDRRAARVPTRSPRAAWTAAGRCATTSPCCFPSSARRAPSADRATLVEAIRCGLATLAAERPAALLLDDLQWSDEATIELLAALALPVRELPLLVVGAYRSDELPRSHPLRRLRHDLRRDRALAEIALEPFDEAQTGELIAQLAGATPTPAPHAAAARPHAAAPRSSSRSSRRRCCEAGRLGDGGDGLELTARRRRAAAGDRARRRAGPPRAAQRRRPRRGRGRRGRGRAARPRARRRAGRRGRPRRAARVRAAGRARRRARPRSATRSCATPSTRTCRGCAGARCIGAIADALRRTGGERGRDRRRTGSPPRDPGRALDALRVAIADRAAVHAYRDATRLGRQAFEIWPEGEQGAERIAALERHARCAELAGELAEAARAQREVVAARHAAGAGRALADAERRMASIYDLQGDRDRALAARRVAAEAFAANELPGRGRGRAAGHRRLPASRPACTTRRARPLRAAREEALRAERADLQARAMGLEGVARVKGGDFDEGIATIQAGLSLGAGARAHPGRRRGLPAPGHRARDRRRLPRGARRARHGPRPLRRLRAASSSTPV